MRSGTLTIENANTEWDARVFDFLGRRPAPREARFDLWVDIEQRTVERDPLYEKPPRGCGWRETLRWIWRVATWRWWDPPLVPAESWRLEGVTLYSVPIDVTATGMGV